MMAPTFALGIPVLGSELRPFLGLMISAAAIVAAHGVGRLQYLDGGADRSRPPVWPLGGIVVAPFLLVTGTLAWESWAH